MTLIRRHSAVAAILVATLLVAACNSGGGTSLTGKVWQWTSNAGSAPGELTENPDPSSYTIEFKDDGTFSAKADCNQVAGNYTTGDNGAMTIVPGPSTLVACPDGSLGDLYVQSLGSVTSYAIVDKLLSLTIPDGTMTFS
jgi:heat shock protein HslJ